MNSLWEIFLDTVAKYPKKIAVADQNNKYTYEELFEKVKSINSLLVKYKTGNPIVVFAGRDINTVAQILAVIGSGNYYIPLDSSLPKEKLEAILDDAKPVAILGKEEDTIVLENLSFKGDFYTSLNKSQKEKILSMNNDEDYETLWKQYFKSTNIEERKNPRLQNRMMPKRYRNNMVEF